MKIRLQSLILNKVFKKRFDDVHAENSIRPHSAVIWCQYIISFISCFIYNSNTWSFSGIQALYKIEIQTLHCNLNKCSKNTTQGVDLDIFKHCSPYVVWNNVQLLGVKSANAYNAFISAETRLITFYRMILALKHVNRMVDWSDIVHILRYVYVWNSISGEN